MAPLPEEAYPLIMSPAMVRATLANLKTATRRIITPQPDITQSNAPGMDDCWYWSWKNQHGSCDEHATWKDNPYVWAINFEIAELKGTP
jgi:hypothetical protein